MPSRMSAYTLYHSTMAARRDSRVHREGAEERRYIHYASHGDPTDLRWIKGGGLQDHCRPERLSVGYLDKMLEDERRTYPSTGSKLRSSSETCSTRPTNCSSEEN